MNTDFEAFKEHLSWLIHPSQIDAVSETEIRLSSKFTDTFPILTELITQARVLSLDIDHQPHHLISWTNKNNEIFGWLTKAESDFTSPLPFIEEHKLLLNEIGGIRESFNQPDPSFSNNQEFMFTGSECSAGINDWNDYYEEQCSDENKPPMDYKNFISFVVEANGATTVYEPQTKEVFLFSHDHAFDNVDFLENQPEYTFHTFHNITSFVDYVEVLAQEWKNEII
ncbi:hypothetical protein [Chryseobacterium sp. BIGb0232]|uniref:hypothetical protein n=1 Tax=Chryseobacterium sp. BIGb0232 TaxID=2940598 RepID=UPI000F49951D|nr:hypothetical protein [Chryseobacterium sp. BIGb0232]MCS4301539.1 hypothetical protein [Chryseobacterium sp. BIGb0232]ROS19606.1 hypothetical protein EDF65_0298 [Chryseobacterium nakagawai]